MYPPAHPTSGLGQLESEVQRLKNDLNRKAESHEIDDLRNRVSRMENTLQALESDLSRQMNELYYSLREAGINI